MGYFPFFADLSGRRGLVVGGGSVALGKIRRLLPFGPCLTAAAPSFLPELEALPGLTLVPGAFVPELLEGMHFVIAATDCREENRRIAALCRERSLPVNAVDDRAACTFLFPALVRRGALTIGISTGGASPTAAAWLKDRIAAEIPEDFEGLLAYLGGLRETVQAVLPEGRRSAVLRDLFFACLEEGWPLEAAALEARMAAVEGEGMS